MTPTLAQQMAGRSGRRGMDRAGHVVYAGITAARIKELISGALPDIVGTAITSPAVCALACFRNCIVPGSYEFDSTLEPGLRMTGLLSMFTKSLELFATRTTTEEAIHVAASQVKAQAMVALTRTVDPKYFRLLFDLRESPSAMFICKSLVPAIFAKSLEWGIVYQSVDAQLIQLYAVLGNFLEDIPASSDQTEWAFPPKEDWAISMLAAISAKIADLPAAHTAANEKVMDGLLCKVLTINSMLPSVFLGMQEAADSAPIIPLPATIIPLPATIIPLPATNIAAGSDLFGDGSVVKEVLIPGSASEKPIAGCQVVVHYQGKLHSSEGNFDSGKDFGFTLGAGSVILGWDQAISTMVTGEKARFTILVNERVYLYLTYLLKYIYIYIYICIPFN